MSGSISQRGFKTVAVRESRDFDLFASASDSQTTQQETPLNSLSSRQKQRHILSDAALPALEATLVVVLLYIMFLCFGQAVIPGLDAEVTCSTAAFRCQ